MIKIEYSTDNGSHWRPWVYYRENQINAADNALLRLCNLYQTTEYMFRMAPADETDALALRRMLYLQGVVK